MMQAVSCSGLTVYFDRNSGIRSSGTTVHFRKNKHEAHLLDKEMLEEFRFMLNYKFDSESPMALVLVGQTELWTKKLKLESYAAIRQRIDMYCTLLPLDRAECGEYIRSHLAYAGCTKDIFTETAIDKVYQISAGVPRMINRVCEKALMYAYQKQNRLIDDHMIVFVAEHEMLGGNEK